MLPEAKNEDLIYATGGCGGVCVLSSPGGKLIGSLSIGGNVDGDLGLCYLKGPQQVLGGGELLP